MRESFYHAACAITGATNPVDAERDVWTYFSGHRNGWPLVNARGERLGFWRDRQPGLRNGDFVGQTASDLVNETDGSCRSWAELFREALAIHGVAATVKAVRPKLTAVDSQLGLPTFTIPGHDGRGSLTRTVGLLVKPFRWKRIGELSPFPFNTEDFVVNQAGYLWKLNDPADRATVQWPHPDVVDLGRSTHGSPEARGIFADHAVVVVNRDGQEYWYDPAFGFGPHPSLLGYEAELLGRGERNPGGLFAIVGWKRERQTDPATGANDERNAGLLLAAAPAPPGPLLEAVDPRA
jgi:hypothetical protein